MPRPRGHDRHSADLHRRIARGARAPLIADREIIVRSRGNVAYIRLPKLAQAAFVLIFGIGVGWLIHTTHAYLAHYEIISARDAVIAAREQANFTLRRELDDARRHFADVTNSLEKNHKGLVSLLTQNRSLEGDIRELRGELNRIEKERDVAENERIDVFQKLAEMETSLHRAQTQNRSLTSELEEAGAQLSAALTDGDKHDRRELSLSGRVNALHGKLASMRDSQTSLIERLAETSEAEVGRLRNLLVSAGLAVDSFLKQQNIAPTAQGGPFEPLGKDKALKPDEAIELALSDANGYLDRLESLQRVIRTIPLAAPLDDFYLSSKYGKRKDPINGDVAMHRGLDFGSRYRAPVYATAPGVVSYAGWKGRYGRFVEIDHGNGIVTRYGHLRRINVKRGQKIDFRAKIGQMGNSGRSTGTHLHYEILVNGDSVDPYKFLKAGKDVFKG